jgi:hypothetical protein
MPNMLTMRELADMSDDPDEPAITVVDQDGTTVVRPAHGGNPLRGRGHVLPHAGRMGGVAADQPQAATPTRSTSISTPSRPGAPPDHRHRPRQRDRRPRDDRDPLGPQHHRERAQHAWQPPGRHDRRHHLRVGQDLGGSVSLERHGPQGGGERVAAHATAAPSGRPGGALDTAWNRRRTPHRGRSPRGRGWPRCRERPGRAGPPTPAAPTQPETGGCAAPPPPPAARLWRRGWAEPQPPARQNGRQAADQQAELGRQQAAKNTHTGTDPGNGSNSPTGAGP